MGLSEQFPVACWETCVVAKHLDYTESLCRSRVNLAEARIAADESAAAAEAAMKAYEQSLDHSDSVRAYIEDEITREELNEEIASETELHELGAKLIAQFKADVGFVDRDAAIREASTKSAEQQLERITEVRALGATFAARLAERNCSGADMSIGMTEEELASFVDLSNLGTKDIIEWLPKNCTQADIMAQYLLACELKLLSIEE